eukprot:1348394-Amorphochlora_amoeboformis.AAC.2
MAGVLVLAHKPSLKAGTGVSAAEVVADVGASIGFFLALINIGARNSIQIQLHPWRACSCHGGIEIILAFGAGAEGQP